jgi:branched-chain amino acid transport system permease protein
VLIATFALNWFNYTLSTQGNQDAPIYMGALLVVVMLFFPRGIIVTIAEFLRRRRWRPT